MSDSNRSQATLPFQLEGHDSVHSAASAFVGSCNSACILVSRLVEYFKVLCHFLEKNMLSLSLTDVSELHNLSQNDLQVIFFFILLALYSIQHFLFKHLQSSFTIKIKIAFVLCHILWWVHG